MKRFAVVLIGLALGVGTYREVLPVFTAEPALYSIFDPHLTCAQATHLSKRVVERLGYALSTTEASGEKETRITATRGGTAHGEKLAVKIVCENDGVHVEAIPDVSPCEQANQRAKQAMEQLQFTVTSFSPATIGKRGVIEGTRDRPAGQETTMATIHCSAEAVYIDASEESPLLTNPEFLKPISDIRRGFFALFKPMAAALKK
jgi:hypothetical protein